jgi:hypothetical protein
MTLDSSNQNTGFIQLVGPFAAGSYIINDYKLSDFFSNASISDGKITRIGITSKPGHTFYIETQAKSGVQKPFVIGPNGMLEFSSVGIKNLRPAQYESQDTKIDLVYDFSKLVSGYTIADYTDPTALSGRPWQEMIIKLSKDLGLDKNLHGYS